MKIREYLSKYKVILVTAVIALIAIVILLVYVLLPPAHALKLIDITSDEYSKNLPSEFDRGIDYTKLKNVVSLGSYIDENINKNFYFHQLSTSSYAEKEINQNRLPSTYIKLPNLDSKESEEFPYENNSYRNTTEIKSTRLVKSDSIKGVKVEVFVATNIESQKHVKDLCQIDFMFKTWGISKEKVEPNSKYSTYETIQRDALLIYSNYKNFSKVLLNLPASFYNNNGGYIEPIKITTMTVITYNPSIEVFPANHYD